MRSNVWNESFRAFGAGPPPSGSAGQTTAVQSIGSRAASTSPAFAATPTAATTSQPSATRTCASVSHSAMRRSLGFSNPTRSSAQLRGGSSAARCRLAGSCAVAGVWRNAHYSRLTDVAQSPLLESGRRDLNPRPPEPHSGALPDCATSREPEPGLNYAGRGQTDPLPAKRRESYPSAPPRSIRRATSEPHAPVRSA